MATANVSVSVKAKTAEYQRKMRAASKTAESFGQKIRRVAAGVAKFGTAITAVAAGSLAYFIKQSFSSLDALAKWSRALGVSVNQLKGLERAAERTGGDAENLRKSITMMTKNVAEVATGTGEAKDALNLLGLDATKLIRLKPDEIFLRIADALGKVRSKTQRIGVLSDIFGSRNAAKLINLLELGSDNIRRMIDDSIRLSGNLNRYMLAPIEAANDAVADLRVALRSIVDLIAIRVSPLVKSLSDSLIDKIVNFRSGTLTRWLEGLSQLFIKALNGAERLFLRIKIGIGEIKVGMMDFVNSVAKKFGVDEVFSLRQINKALNTNNIPKNRLYMLQEGLLPGLGTRLLSDPARKAMLGLFKSELGSAGRGMREGFRWFTDLLFGGPASPLRALLGGQLATSGGHTASGLAGAMAMPRINPGQFREISLSRFGVPAINGTSGGQLVRDPQLMDTNRILRSIDSKTGAATAVTVP